MFHQYGRIDSRQLDWAGWFVQPKSVRKLTSLLKEKEIK